MNFSVSHALLGTTAALPENQLPLACALAVSTVYLEPFHQLQLWGLVLVMSALQDISVPMVLKYHWDVLWEALVTIFD